MRRRLRNGPCRGVAESDPSFLRHYVIGEVLGITDGDDPFELARLGQLKLPP
jgi:hypothetical protein